MERLDNPVSLTQCVDRLADTKFELRPTAEQIYRMPLTDDEVDYVEAMLLTEKNLFRCACCCLWLPSTRIDPETDVMCSTCALGEILR